MILLITIVILVAIVVWFIKSPSKPLSTKEALDFGSVEDIASTITTHAKLASLEKKIERMHEKSSDYSYKDQDEKYEENEEKIKIYDEALNLASDNIFKYIVCDIDFKTPFNILSVAGKAVSIEDISTFSEDEHDSYFEEVALGDVESVKEVTDLAKDYIGDTILYASIFCSKNTY